MGKTEKTKESIKYFSIFLTVMLVSLTGLFAWLVQNLNFQEWRFWLGVGGEIVLFLLLVILHFKIMNRINTLE